MSFRWVAAIIAVFALLLTGCGSDKEKASTPTAKSSSEQAEASSAESSEPDVADDAPQEQLDSEACVEVTQANLDLAVATNGEEAQAAADVFAKYSPPASVQESIDHFVETEGVQFDDPDFDEYNDRIDGWVKEVCPL